MGKVTDNCSHCQGLGWLDDPTACGDPEHCSPIFPCPECNPDGLEDGT